MRWFLVVLFPFLILLSPLSAKDLGVVGTTFKIAEPCLLKTILGKLASLQKSGKLEELQRIFQGRVLKSLARPSPVPGLKKATSSRRRFYDPTLTLTSDLKDLQGRVFGRKGQQVNPLEYIPFGDNMIFFDADDPEQLAWAQREPVDSKWVLVKGAPLDLQKQMGRPVYFDQGGLYTKKFGIEAIPTRLSQEGKKLLIDEINLMGTEEK